MPGALVYARFCAGKGTISRCVGDLRRSVSWAPRARRLVFGVGAVGRLTIDDGVRRLARCPRAVVWERTSPGVVAACIASLVIRRADGYRFHSRRRRRLGVAALDGKVDRAPNPLHPVSARASSMSRAPRARRILAARVSPSARRRHGRDCARPVRTSAPRAAAQRRCRRRPCTTDESEVRERRSSRWLNCPPVPGS